MSSVWQQLLASVEVKHEGTYGSAAVIGSPSAVIGSLECLEIAGCSRLPIADAFLMKSGTESRTKTVILCVHKAAGVIPACIEGVVFFPA